MGRGPDPAGPRYPRGREGCTARAYTAACIVLCVMLCMVCRCVCVVAARSWLELATSVSRFFRDTAPLCSFTYPVSLAAWLCLSKARDGTVCLVGSWPPRLRYDSVRPDEVRGKAMPGGAGRACHRRRGGWGRRLPALILVGSVACRAAPFSTFALDREVGGRHGS